jgi:enoyl-CoA hydratase/carnithine racemase
VQEMQKIFSYNNFELRLDSNYKCLWIDIISENDYINLEFLFEFESILAWCTQRSEINAIVFKSNSDLFGKGFDPEYLQRADAKQLEKFHSKMQIIVQALGYLPQTLIGDIGLGAANVSSELILGMDLRICHRDCEMSFNHTELGILAANGASTLLNSYFGRAIANNILLGGKTLDSYFLKEHGLVLKTYTDENREQVMNELLSKIAKQAPVQRIQTKGLLNELTRIKISESMETSKKYFKAALINEDYKESQTREFMNAKSMGTVLEFSREGSPFNNH